MLSFLCCTGADGVDGDEEARARAATKIQASQRGKMGRRTAAGRQAEIESYKRAAGDGTAVEELGDGSGRISDKLLMIEVLSASKLRNCVSGFLGGKSSPFVKCDVGDITFCTEIKKNNLNPVWNESFEVIDYAGQDIKLTVFHPAVKKSREVCLGLATIPAADFAGANGTAQDLQLTNTGTKTPSTLKIKINWVEKQNNNRRISAYKENTDQRWIVRTRPIGLRAGPGVNEKRVMIDLQPGEEFDVVEIVEGAGGQSYVRLKDGRGWAFSKSPKDGEALCEVLEMKAEPAGEFIEAGDVNVNEADVGGTGAGEGGDDALAKMQES